MTVIKVLKRVEELEVDISLIMAMEDKELVHFLYPKRTQKTDEYLIPDYKWEEFQMVKHIQRQRRKSRRTVKNGKSNNGSDRESYYNHFFMP